MRKQPGPMLSASLLSAALMLGAGPGAHAQENHSQHVDAAADTRPAALKKVRWSDPAAWPDGKVPAEGDAVTIARDTEVVLDVSPPALRSVTVDGKLSFANDRDLELKTEWIYLRGGELHIGEEGEPYTRQASITLTDTVKGENINTMGDRGIMLMRGTLSLHGDREHTWTKLSKTAAKGANRIEVLNAAGWRRGDEIVLASTDFDPRQAERRTITAINGNNLTLDRPLEYMHFGEITFGVDERGEVGLLSRNIRIQASEDADQNYFGGHIMAMVGSKMQVSGIELSRMGQHLTLARYPIHWHINGDGNGQYIKNASIHDTYSRCVTVHGTDNLLIQNNVTFNTVGHCFFIEDGIETGNQFIKNLAIQTKCHPTLECVPTNIAPNGESGYDYANRAAYRQASFFGGNTLLPSDNTVASFWITNPDNSFIDNVAAGSDQAGFWLSLPEHPNGAFLGTEASLKTWPRRTLLRAFRGNIAHSNYDGFMFDRNIAEDNTFALAGNTYLPLKDPNDPRSEALVTYFDDLVAYKIRNQGFWGRGELFTLRNARFADNAIGMTMSSGSFGTETYTSLVTDSLFVGETDNVGNPRTPEEVAYGRSLPKPLIPDYPIRAYEYYDYRNEVQDTTFVNYQDNDLRKTGALSWLMFNSSGVTTASTVKTATYINAKPVYFPQIDTRFDNDNRGGNSWRTLSILDLDGTTSGIPMSHINLHDGENNSVVTDDTCVIKPDWNASVCKGDVGRLSFAPQRPGGFTPGRPGTRPPGAPSILAGLANPPPPQPPITLVRNGTEFKVAGSASNVRAGTEIRVVTERPEIALSLSEMDQGSWVIFELPGFANAASGREQASLDALRKANETSYFRDGDTLWAKVVVTEAPRMPVRPLDIQASLAVSRQASLADNR